MQRRNWNVILPIAVASGYATFHVWGAFLAPIGAVAVFAWIDRRASRPGRMSEEERFAEFMRSAGTDPIAAPVPVPDPAAETRPAEAERLARDAVASKSIALAVRSSDIVLATALFAEFSALRDQLTLDAATWNKLGQALLERGEFADAACALHAAAVAMGDSLAAQKRLAEIAGKAAAAGEDEVAKGLYVALVEKYPDAGLASFARARAEAIADNIGRRALTIPDTTARG